MKYSVIKVINGNFSIHTETDDINSAKVQYYGLCQTLWNASDVIKARAMIVDENLNRYQGYIEHISHEVAEEE